MTREEAIKELEFHLERQDLYDDIFLDACRLAIEALQERIEGRWVELPVDLGGTVWYVSESLKEVCQAKVVRYIVHSYTEPPLWLEVEYTSKLVGTQVHLSRADIMLDRIVFLTKEEAEKALADMRESE